MSRNTVILRGNVGGDPEIKSVGSSGTQVANFSLATSERWNDKQSGEKKERTQWHRIVVWSEPLIKLLDKYVRKGDNIEVEGQLETRKWQDQSGSDRYATEVVLRPYKSSIDLIRCKAFDKSGARGDAEDSAGDRVHAGNADAKVGTARKAAADNMDDEIPFN